MVAHGRFALQWAARTSHGQRHAQGQSLHTVGELPEVGSPGPNVRLTRGELSDISLADFEGKVEILNIVPTFDTGVRAASARARAGSSRPGVPGVRL